MTSLQNAMLVRKLAVWATIGWLLLSSQLSAQEPKPRLTLDRFADSVAISPDGKILACGGYKIRFCDAESGKETDTLKCEDGVASVAFSPDGKMLASGSDLGEITLWDLKTRKGTTITDLYRDRGQTRRFLLVFSPDGKTLASAGECMKEIRLWNVATGKLLSTLEAHDRFGTLAVVFSPNGKSLVSHGANNGIKFWDVKTGKQTGSRKTKDDLSVAAFTLDGKTLATIDYDSEKIKLWDVATGNVRATLKAEANMYCSMTFSPDGNTLAFGNGAGEISLWDVEKNKEFATLNGHTKGKDLADGAVKFLTYSADGKLLLSTRRNHAVQLWDLKTK